MSVEDPSEFYVVPLNECRTFQSEWALLKMFMHSLKHFDDWTDNRQIIAIYSVVYAVVFAVGVVGNGLLIQMLLKGRTSVANLLLINLAFSDLLLCFTVLPISPSQMFMKVWVFGQFLCKLVPIIQTISALLSTYCLCFIAVDRYRSIVTPMNEPMTLTAAKVLVALTWIVALLLASPLYIAMDKRKMNGVRYCRNEEECSLAPNGYVNVTMCGEFCGEFNWQRDELDTFGPIRKRGYGALLLIVQFVIPAIILTISYWKILQKVRVDWIVEEGSMLTSAQQAQTAVRKRRVMYVLILMVVVFMGSWLPMTIANILRDLSLSIHHQDNFVMLNCNVLAMSSVVWNPLLYFWLSKRHRRALKDDMFWLTNAKRSAPSGVLARFAPSPSVSFVYRRTLERHLGAHHFRRGTLADPTNMMREALRQEMQPNCFLLVPLMPLCQTIRRNSTLAAPGTRGGLLSPRGGRQSRRPSTGTIDTRVGESMDK